MWDRRELKMRAKGAFMKNYGSSVLVALLMGMLVNFMGSYNISTLEGFLSSNQSGEILGLFSMILVVAGLIVGIVTVFVANILEVGGCKFFIKNQTEQPGVGMILDIFRSGNYLNVAVTMFFRDLYIFLWSLLFLVPGIIKSYEYRMIPYILAENPGMDRKEAFMISRKMMDGQKMDFFILELSFYGWILLSFLTCNLLNVFFIAPYMQASFAEAYYYTKVKAYQEGYIR